MPRATLPLAEIVVATLVLAASGCCSNVEEEPWSADAVGELEGADMDAIRSEHTTPEDRCAAACVEVMQATDGRYISMGDVTMCEAFRIEPVDGEPEDPWDPSYSSVAIMCTAEGTYIPFCTGRRPLGHREAAIAVASAGEWFAIHAHLEAAAVAAFDELAAWLEDRGAPPELIARCRAARADEVDHAARMAKQARRRGASVPKLEATLAPDDLLSVALHNAVEGCVSEAFAAVVARHQAEHADDRELRELFTILAEDELRHGQLAWDLHAWLLDQLTPAQRGRVLTAQAEALAALPRQARAGAEATPTSLGWPDPERAEALAERFAALILDEPVAA